MDRAVFRGRQARAAGVLSSMFLLWFPLYLALSVFVVLLLVKIYSLVSVGRCTCRRSMSGKTVIITGANSGVGKETARELCRRGARVILACRDVDKARLAASDIAGETGVQPLCMQLDLCSFESVRHFAQQVLEREERLDVLINNAGALPPPERRETEDGFEVTFQANHLGHFLLTNLLLGLLKKTAPSRIINVGSTAHWFGRFEVDNIGFKRYIQNRIYSNTKLYNMLFTVELAQRLAGTGVTANCCHPGFVKSHLADRTGDFHARLVDFLVHMFGKNTGVGKETARELCKRGARVILACRDADKARLAASDIARNTGVQPVCMQLDLCSFESVRQFAQQVLEREERLDVLINNAGKIATAKKTETEDGFESTLQTNHLGHFLLSNLLLDLLKKSAPSRVIVVGSSVIWWARMDRSNIDFSRYYDRVGVYNTTKLYNMLFVVALSRRLNGTAVTVNCCHPGVVRTNLASGSNGLPSWIANLIQKCFGKSPEQGAQTSVHCAVSYEAGSVSGKYFADCRQARTPRLAIDPENAEFLWKASKAMAGLQ